MEAALRGGAPGLALTLTLPHPHPSPSPSPSSNPGPNPSPNPNPNQVHPASRNDMVELVFTEPVKLRPGQSCGFYVHSALPGDEAIVYDNQRSSVTYQDRCFKVMPGLAHLSNKPFGKRGFWGRPWRTNREFVGRINYGALLCRAHAGSVFGQLVPGGCFQRQITPQAAPGSGQPRPISPVGPRWPALSGLFSIQASAGRCGAPTTTSSSQWGSARRWRR